jgi:putative chitinase
VTTKELLDHIAGCDTGALGEDIATGLDKYCPQYEINTHLRLSHFLAQACEETDGFRLLTEVWGPTAAQKNYEGRVDLGNVRKGDGYLYRGRGIFEITGRDNYARIGKALSLPLELDPDLAADPQVSVRIAGYYWSSHQINVPADADNIIRVTKAINGGLNGLTNRELYFSRAREVLP